ncbi:cytochrome-c oxidase, cbb3-type subunit III [Zwartia sp.]|uniref:cytochrome-c oxidase, cbb3-type subunit III n=1 Tax=Zwartia sp. TaxID=2978004 RepID=UPI003BAEA5D3
MSDFFNGFWGYYIAIIAVGGIVWCLWLLFSQRKWLINKKPGVVEDTGHVWDGDLRELNNPVPRWWTFMYIIMCVVGLGYLVLYPGLGAYQGVLGYTTAVEVKDDQTKLNEEVKPVYARFAAMDIPAIAADPDARIIGQRLFLNNCAQCHGSDARGAVSFPNLAQGDSMYGRTPEALHISIAKGRNGVMPPMSANISPKSAGEIAQYVRSMSGLAHDQIRVIPGKREYLNNCVACHGVDGKGNKALGAPNLTDDVWLYGSSEATIVNSILNGRNNRMPAQEHVLTPEQIRLLSAWVWGLSGGKDVTVSAAMSGNTAK